MQSISVTADIEKILISEEKILNQQNSSDVPRATIINMVNKNASLFFKSLIIYKGFGKVRLNVSFCFLFFQYNFQYIFSIVSFIYKWFFFNSFGTKIIQLTQHFREIYSFGRKRIQHFVPFLYYVGIM